jgi:small subunit ribosomal protein S2
LTDLDDMATNGTLEQHSKREAIGLRREREKLERSLGGIKAMDSLPDLIFVVDVGHEKIALAEARKLGIPVVAIVDTNCTPDGVDYVIPGNDDAMRAVQLYLAGIADAVLEGKTSAPSVPTSEDEFVELDEEGKPKPKGAPARKPRPGASVKKKTPPRKRAAVASPAAAGVEVEVEAEAEDDDLDDVPTDDGVAKRAPIKRKTGTGA